MVVESGSDLQRRRRRRRDPEEPEKTELSERELAVAVAVSQENEERWVRPLPVEAIPATKRKISILLLLPVVMDMSSSGKK
uniref:Uncharacterized protein n=1 Tax=Aotus nancymaae TaxID=37293 RepID=A0A2K5DUY5_AOTNA